MLPRGAIVVVIPPRGFPGQAFLSLVERLREHGTPVVIASAEPGRCTGAGGVTVTAERAWNDPYLLDAAGCVILDDGAGTVARDAHVRHLLGELDERRAVLAGVGAGVLVLVGAGFLRGRPTATRDDAGAELLRRLGAVPVLGVPRVLAGDRLLTATEAGAPAVADELDGFLRVGSDPRPPV